MEFILIRSYDFNQIFLKYLTDKGIDNRARYLSTPEAR
jgi:hypothetical protein